MHDAWNMPHYLRRKAASLSKLDAKLAAKEKQLEELFRANTDADRFGRLALSISDHSPAHEMVLTEARLKFNELDLNNDEVLDGTEAAMLAVFVLEKVPSTHPVAACTHAPVVK